MSIEAISWVLKFSKSRLGARHVAISIASHAQPDGTGAWPSVSTIARESNLSEREARYGLRVLEDLGELVTRRKAGPNGCNLYSLPSMKGQTLPGGGAKSAGGMGQNSAGGGANSAPEPSLKQPSTATRSGAAKPGPPPDPRFRLFLDFAFEAFRMKYLAPPTWDERQYKALRIFLQNHPRVELPEWQRRYRNFMASTDPFYRQQACSLGYFSQNFDRFIEGPLLERQYPLRTPAGKSELKLAELEELEALPCKKK